MRGLLVPLLLAAAAATGAVSAEHYPADVDSAAELWKDLMDSGDLPPVVSERDLKFILNNAPTIAKLNHQEAVEAAEVAQDEAIEEAVRNNADMLDFPQLDRKQKQFAVHPGFKSFYDPKFRTEEGIDEDGNAEEVAFSEDLLGRSDEHQNLKKASYDPMARSITSREVEQARINDIYFTTIVAVSSALAVFAIIGAGFCYHRVRRNSKASEDVEYPAYGVTGPGKETSPTSGTDRKLAQNAQMYHYQHQKQQMIAFDSANGGERRNGASASDCESDDGEEGDYTVYECPGLAPAGEMEVHNPLFQDDPTPKAK